MAGSLCWGKMIAPAGQIRAQAGQPGLARVREVAQEPGYLAKIQLLPAMEEIAKTLSEIRTAQAFLARADEIPVEGRQRALAALAQMRGGLLDGWRSIERATDRLRKPIAGMPIEREPEAVLQPAGMPAEDEDEED